MKTRQKIEMYILRLSINPQTSTYLIINMTFKYPNNYYTSSHNQ